MSLGSTAELARGTHDSPPCVPAHLLVNSTHGVVRGRDTGRPAGGGIDAAAAACPWGVCGWPCPAEHKVDPSAINVMTGATYEREFDLEMKRVAVG